MTYIDLPKFEAKKGKDSYQEISSEIIITEMLPVEEENVLTVSDIVNGNGIGLFQIAIALFCGSYFCAESCELIMLSFALPELRNKWDLSRIQESLIGSIVFFGLFVGSLFWGYVSDKMGRKFGFILCSFVLSSFGILRSLCLEYYTFNICGFFCGWAIGGGVVTFSLFLEYLPKKMRGLNYILIELFWVVGGVYTVVTAWIVLTPGFIFSRRNIEIYLFVSKIPACISFIFSLIVPESLRFLSVGHDEENIRKISGLMSRMNCKNFSTEGYEIKFQGEKNDKTKGRIRDLFSRSLIIPFISICILYVCGSLSYYGVVMSTPNFFGANRNAMYFGTLVMSCAETPGIVIPALFLPVIGRKMTQTLACFLCGISLLLLCCVQSSDWLVVVVGVFARGSAMATSSITWVLAQETFPTNVRSVGCGISSGLGKVGTILAPIIADLLPYEHALIPKIIFSFLTIFAGFVCIFYPLETKGRELEDFIQPRSKPMKGRKVLISLN